ncbi:hypothetical protein [Alteromonas gracilis]|uniref:Uncharacterized protein n=1 Tax=Alteromonas gracilis TaxID=1479524 RepID=A0ABX5CQM5_9ALTE|nr:hypothetical protein [Alteromonas gracilis]PRO69889.1 hypothetical protein C6Y39_05460 [Alteromonas gracilis]
MKENAILLVGELRLAKENSEQLKKLSDNFDVFVVTNSRYSDSVKFLGNVKDILFVENVFGNDSHDIFYEEELGIPHALQMHKAYLAYELLKRSEERIGLRYKTVFKIRTDWDIGYNLDINIFKQADENNQFLFIQSDMFYGGGRETAEIWSKFYFQILPFYYDRLDEYWPLDCPDLSDCDLEFAGLNRFPFPSELVGCPTSREDLEHILKERWHEIKNYKKRDVPFFRLQNIEPKFPCEAAFLHYILKNGLKFKKLDDQRIPLDEARFYGDIDALCIKMNNSEFEEVARFIARMSPAYKLGIPQAFIIKLKSRNLIDQHQFISLCYHAIPLLVASGFNVDRLETMC